MSQDCKTFQDDGFFVFDPEASPAVACTPAGIKLPEKNEFGCYLVYHCTSVEKGVKIMRDARMRVLPTTPENWPQGIYSARRPAEWYNKGCIVTRRIAGVIGSQTISHLISQSTDMCPLGFILVLWRSVEDRGSSSSHHYIITIITRVDLTPRRV